MYVCIMYMCCAYCWAYITVSEYLTVYGIYICTYFNICDYLRRI